MSEIKVPAMGESITEGTVSRWMVKEGETVNQGDVLLELETDKVNIEISAEESGVLEKIIRQEGETVEIGETIGTLSTALEEEAVHPLPNRQRQKRKRPLLLHLKHQHQQHLLRRHRNHPTAPKRLHRPLASLHVNVVSSWIRFRAKIQLDGYTRTT